MREIEKLTRIVRAVYLVILAGIIFESFHPILFVNGFLHGKIYLYNVSLYLLNYPIKLYYDSGYRLFKLYLFIIISYLVSAVLFLSICRNMRDGNDSVIKISLCLPVMVLVNTFMVKSLHDIIRTFVFIIKNFPRMYAVKYGLVTFSPPSIHTSIHYGILYSLIVLQLLLFLCFSIYVLYSAIRKNKLTALHIDKHHIKPILATAISYIIIIGLAIQVSGIPIYIGVPRIHTHMYVSSYEIRIPKHDILVPNENVTVVQAILKYDDKSILAPHHDSDSYYVYYIPKSLILIRTLDGIPSIVDFKANIEITSNYYTATYRVSIPLLVPLIKANITASVTKINSTHILEINSSLPYPINITIYEYHGSHITSFTSSVQGTARFNVDNPDILRVIVSYKYLGRIHHKSFYFRLKT